MFLPPIEYFVRFRQADLIALDIHAPYCDLNSFCLVGKRDHSEYCLLDVEFPSDVYTCEENDETMTIHSNGPAVHDVSVSKSSAERLSDAVREAHKGFRYPEYTNRCLETMEAFFTEEQAGEPPGPGRAEGSCCNYTQISNRLSMLNIRLIELVLDTLDEGKPYQFHLGPAVLNGPGQEFDRLVTFLKWYKVRYPTLEYHLAGWSHPLDWDAAEKVEKESGLKILKMEFDRPKWMSRDTSALSLLARRGPKAAASIRWDSVELRDLAGGKVDVSAC